MGDGLERIHEKIKSFQKKYYLNIFIRGIILTLSIIFFYFLGAALLEHSLWLNQWARFSIFFAFIAVVIYCVYKFLKQPLLWWISRRGLGEEQSAKIIGEQLPNVNDGLVNLLQLSINASKSDLAYASIQQKSKTLEPISFESVVDLKYNKRYLKYLVVPVSIILIILLVNRTILTQSAERLIHFNQHFAPQAPFKFIVLNHSLTAFYNEDFTLRIKLEGQAITENLYIVGAQRLKMEPLGDGNFIYTFEKLQEGISFQLEGAGFYSEKYDIALANRPELIKFNVNLEYPKYLQRKNESLNNAGNIEIPEGTTVRWNLNTTSAEKATLVFTSDKQLVPFEISDDQIFTLSKKFVKTDQYEVILENEKSRNKEKIVYQVEVIKDEFPQLIVNNFKDSVLYKHIMLGGSLADDYGITQLSLHYSIRDENQKDVLKKTVNININRNQLQQNFFFNWSLDSLKLKPEEQLEYFLQVWDNDGVNGRKYTKSANYTFKIPSENNFIAEINKSRIQTEQKISQSVSKANKLQDQIELAYQKLKGKQSLDWQDKKKLEDIVEQKQNLDQMINDLKEQNKLLQEKKEAFSEQDERIKEKAEQIQKLMDQLLDDETKKMLEELEKLLKENADVSDIQKLLDKLNKNTSNLEKDLDRMLALFKQVEYETKFDQVVEKLRDQVKEQKSLIEKTKTLENDNKKSLKSEKNEQGKENEKLNNTELAKQQEKLMEDFKKTSDKIDDLKKIGEELQKDEKLPTEQEMEQVQDEQEQSKESLDENKPSKAKQSQQKALEKMQKMQQMMEGMQSEMEMDMEMQNLESLRQIIHGLIKLSFDQEELMKKFSDLQQNDPKFNVIAQRQLKLKDDAKVLEDSLLLLSKKDPFMGSFITREVSELNYHFDKVNEANRERKRPQASNEMQLSMTTINNLTLMLDDQYDMMIQMMANAKPSMKKSKQKGKKPSLSQMQQQLNNKIQDLKNSGKGGRQLSEELIEMAAEQEKIRKALKDMQQKMHNEGQMPGGDIPSKMEQTEMDLVNKQLTDQMIKRQKEILTRLLETEKSMREQDMDDERKGEVAKDYDKEIPKAFEEYLRIKEKEVEFLRTVPPKLYPYYKKEVGEYFKRIGNP